MKGDAKQKLSRVGRELHAKGMSDAAIAAEVGCVKSRVRAWRKQQRLPANPHNGHTAKLNAIGHGLHEFGWTDPMIAKKLGCTKALVCRWRKRHGLPANAPSGSDDWKCCRVTMVRKAEEVARLHGGGVSDADGAALLGITKDAYSKRRTRMGLEEDAG